MKLLIITQKVDKNDAILGFFHDWLMEFAKHFEVVSVICLQKGEYTLPDNIRVYSLGKESGGNKIKYLLTFYRYIFSLKSEYDSVFVHMNQIYVIIGGFFWRLWQKKIVLWYSHRKAGFSIWLAEKIANSIFSSAPESFRVKSRKAKFIGHGIDTCRFDCAEKEVGNDIKILSVGRITQIKNCDIAIRALAFLNVGKRYSLKFVGKPITTNDITYLEILNRLIKELRLEDRVEFVGEMTNLEIAQAYCESDLTLNLVPTGGLDKVVIESFASKRPCFTSNRIFKPFFGEHGEHFIVDYRNPEDLAKKIQKFLSDQNMKSAVSAFSNKVKNEYSIRNLINKISESFT